ncbi:expressed unknown protein [Seminavis robusta]|uniref:WW domain-containing protein n=1 Tax=Seminavis robusta TaxID=568900 RepID=A0A9N8ES42_9STRA|nr:expressed unknown protein [Seminavis robusta]|eukprot:Sro1542_g281060.1 n/a (596) ;mRNA; r:14345-16132
MASADPPGFRTPEMSEELEQLRQRGLAKSLNKHFTNECKKVEAELAAADLALRELETRKTAADQEEFLQLETMYMKVLEWKKVCRKREQETVLLYAKYCEKFGNSIKLAKPEEIFTPRKDPPTKAAPDSPLVMADVDALAKAFEEGIPDFLRPVEASAPSSYNPQQLAEILEDASLSDSGKVKVFTGTPCTTDATEMGSEFDDSSIVSGLTTLNSQVTKEVLQTVHKNVLEFIKSETENIRRLMEEEDAMSKAEFSVQGSQHSSSQVEAILEHENMVKKMQQVLDDFKQAEAETEKTLKGTQGRLVEGAGNEGECWYEQWDETFQRNYYVEINSKTTQWHKPSTVSVENSSYNSLGDSAESSVLSEAHPVEPKVLDFDFKPDMRAGSRNRLILYKAKQSRKKKRQMTTVAFLLAGLATGLACYGYANPEQMDLALDALTSRFSSAGASVEEVPVAKKTNKKNVKKPAAKKDVKKPATMKDVKTTQMPAVEDKQEKEAAKKKPAAEIKHEDETKTSPTQQKVAEYKTPVPVRPAFMSESTKVVSKAKEEEDLKGVAPIGSEAAPHWIRDVLVGHHAFKKVSKLCREPSTYCGSYRA